MINPFTDKNNSTRKINEQLESTASALQAKLADIKETNKQLEGFNPTTYSQVLGKMDLVIRRMRLEREQNKLEIEQRRLNSELSEQERTNKKDDKFLEVLTELAKLTQRSKAEVLASALNLYYRAVTLPAPELELLRSFLEDLEKKQGINWSATANPPEPPSVA